uniref:Inositol oxygenase n=1 Tax=Cercocebus atys TaxID=9531 RepID=A0A2K5LA49_CERAT
MKVTVGPDPSLVYRPDVDPEVAKDKASFRNYTSGPKKKSVFTTYKLMHTHQTVDFEKKKHAQFGGFSYKKKKIMEAVDLLDGLVDESDPDVDFPNSFHAFQTAEGIRKAQKKKVPNLPCPSPSQTGSTLLGSCTTWGRSWPCSGSPSGRSSETPSLSEKKNRLPWFSATPPSRTTLTSRILDTAQNSACISPKKKKTGSSCPGATMQVRPLHQVPRPAGRGQAAALLPGAH